MKIEAYGMGRMAAQYGEENNIPIPNDILTELARMYGMDPEELMKVFVKGMMIEREDLGKRNGPEG